MNKCIKKIKIRKLVKSKSMQNLVDDQVIVEEEVKLTINNNQEVTLLCSPENIKELIAGFRYTQGQTNNPKNAQQQKLQINPDIIFSVMDQLHAKQKLFKATGGAHAAGIFNQQGEMLAFAEDVARHNAFDKAIGMCLLNKIEMQNCGVVLSSRVSAEMVHKAVKGKLRIIVAVSAPTALAIEIAEKNKIILCGFVRDGNANVYTV